MQTKTNEVIEQVEVVEGTNPFTPAVIEDAVSVEAFSPAMFENPGSVFFSTIKDDGSRDSAVKMYNAVNDAEYHVSDFLGKEILITDMVAHPQTLEEADKVTGEIVVKNLVRVVLIDTEGNGYHSMANGVIESMKRLIAMVGQGPWEPALKVVPTEKKTNTAGRKTIVLSLKG